MSTFDERYEERQKQGNDFQSRYIARQVQSGKLNLDTIGTEISDRINSWLEKHNSFVTSYQNRFENVGDSYRSDSADWLAKQTEIKNSYDTEAQEIIHTLNMYKPVFGDEWVNDMKNLLANTTGKQNEILSAYDKENKFWSQWDSEDAYNRAKTISDITQMSADELKAHLGDSNPVAFVSDDGQNVTWEALYKQRSKEEYEARVMSEADFNTYSAAGAAKGSVDAPSWKFWATPENKIAEMRSNPDLIESYERSAREADGATSPGVAKNVLLDQIEYKAAKYMTDNEYAIYNYYVGKGDNEQAEAYLASIEEELNIRQAGKMVGDIQGNRLKELAFAFEAGVNQFISGARNLDNWITGTDPDLVSAVQYANSEISKNLEGGWKVGYDLLNTTGNMLPSILVSAIPVPGAAIAGTASMGLSAAGNAYAEMRSLGYDAGASQNYALLVGASEATLQYALGGISKLGGKVSGNVISNVVNKVDNAIAKVAIQLGGSMLSEGFEEATQSVLEPIFKMLTTGEDFEGINIEEVVYSGLLGMLSAGFLEGGTTIGSAGINAISTAIDGKKYKATYGADVGGALAAEALDINANNSFAQKMQNKVNSGKELSSGQVGRLVRMNETAMYENDIASIQNAAENRLTELGEKGDVKAIAEALTKQASGEELTRAEKNLIKNSTFGQRVANELNADNINSGGYSSSWAQKIGTDRINADEYSRLLQSFEAESGVDGAAMATEGAVAAGVEASPAIDTPQASAEIAQSGAVDVQNTPESVQTDSVQAQALEGEAKAVQPSKNAVAHENAAEAKNEAVADISDAQEETLTVEKASKKYGAQAGAMIATYTAGQDVAQFDAAYSAAYSMGKSGVSLDYAMNSETTAYLTESQRKLAHAAGVDAANMDAHARDAVNKSKANGKTGRRKGVVRGRDVSIDDLKKTFNDKQGVAYKLLSTYAEATGIDIVLYKSETDADGNFIGSQGKFKWSEDTIYIDINAGLENIKDVGSLAKYTMMRTFSHEFTHFIEKWNPIWYNELRKVVFDTITERGENVETLITAKMEQMGLDLNSPDATEEEKLDYYNRASREVVAEAMTDILPDANFVEELATKHKTIFDKLLDMLRDFVADLKAYFNGLGNNPAREANALKEQVGESVKYMESIVKLFDKVAVEAVENYQATVAVEEVTENSAKITSTESINADNNAENVSETANTKAYEHFSVTDDTDNRVTSIKFDGKPSNAVREILRNNAFVWNRSKGEWFRSGKWYGKSLIEDVIYELDRAYEAEKNAPATKNTATETLREMGGKAVGDNMTDVTDLFFPELAKTAEAENDTEISQLPKKEVNTNVEETGAVLPHRSDGQGDTRLLAESQAEDVSRDGAERNAVDDAGERRGEAGRDDHSADAERNERGHGEGSSESRDIRRNDELTPEAEKLHEEVAEQISHQSTEQPRGRNFVIGESLDLPNGEKARYKANIEAIRLVKQLESEGRYATEAEQVILSKYVGWGGLDSAFDYRKAEWTTEYNELKELLTDDEFSAARASTTDAFYTDIPVIKAMYDGLTALGFVGGRLLEPSSGVGNFVGAMPADMSAKVKSWTMVELDNITGLIAKYLYPNADVRIQGFEKANIPNSYMDVAIGNVPFGNVGVYDKAYPKKVTSSIHNYFFAKSLDKVRPGGIVMFITSSGTMGSKDSTVRSYIMKKADLLGAIRLPDTAFKSNAGTNVVADILILKKRADNTAYAGEDFLNVSYDYNIGDYTNSYFTNHPEMVLGVPTATSGRYGRTVTYKALEGKGSLADQIREAFKSIKGKMEYPATLSREKTNFAVERAGKKTKENGLVVKDGKVYQNKDGELVEISTASGVAERVSGLLDIRDAARELMNYQQQGLNDTEIKKARTKLNKLYDAFVKKHGYLNAQANKNALRDDPDKFSIFALENWNPDTKKATKADIFSKNTISPNRTVTSAKDVAEGLIVSVNQTGGVDTALIARLTGKTEADVTRELIDSRKAFKNRNGALEAAETYLSGNVRAKLRDAEALVPIDGDYQNNVEALKSVIPADVGYQDIFVNAGTPWIPNSVYSDFAAYMLGGRNTEWRQDVDITRNAETGNFTVELKSKYLKTNAANTQKWGTSRRTFIELFDAMLNSKSVVIKDKLDDGSFIINKDATAAANEKIENIQKEFQEWLWKDEARRTELATLYNETFNSIVTPKYNGDNLTVNGANANKPLRPHQRNAVQRVISSGGNTLLAHKVGAGKTYEMAAAAMKLKELGLVKKPMFAVPKSLVAQWGNEFMDFFPTAKLLVAEASDFTAGNRKVFMNRIANGEYDAVIVSYEQFEKLPMSDDFTRELYQEQINSVIAAIEEAKADKGDKALSVKDLEKKRKSLQAKIDKLTDKAKDEDNIDFEALGVDSLFVDEAHNFKNLFYTTSMTNVSGLGNKDGSKRAFDLYTKVRYLQKLNGGRGIVFATATPVMNSMSEMYIMQKYLQPDILNQLGLSTFDAWAKQFGEVVNGVEIKPSGQGYRVKQSFSRFKNMSELQLLFRNFADVLTDIPGLKIPKMKGGRVNVVVCEPGQFQQDYMKELEKRADNIKNVDPSEDNMLKITSDGRKISYTQRMIDPSLPYEEGCKIFRCADNVIKAYNESAAIKGTQLIFCDMATPKGKSNNNNTETEELETDMESAKLYDDIKARLRQGGIPAKEIAFIHEADTDAKKKKLFADVNDGKVRVLIGSTGKMGVGMNAQKRVVAIHHLDAPWRPGDVEQRNGRAFRQGNINDEVECFTYVTEGSFDARLWDILERKQNFINQVMNGESVGRETEDTGEVTLSAAEVKALASGSPLIMEQVQLDTDIKKLESLYRAHTSAVRSAKERLARDNSDIAMLERQIAAGKFDVATRTDTYTDEKFSITVGKTQFTDKKDAGVALMAEATAKATFDTYNTIGKFAGFELRVIKSSEGIKGMLVGKQGYPFKTYPTNTTFMITQLAGVVESIDERVKVWEHSIEETQRDIAEQEKLIREPFAKQAELDTKRARYNEVMDILNPKEEQSLDSVAEDTVQEQSRDYLHVDDDIRDDIRYPTDKREASAFIRSYANKTALLEDGETALMTIYTHYRVFFVEATGYLRGNIINSVIVTDNNEQLVNKLIGEFYNGTYEITGGTRLLAESIRNAEGRGRRGNVNTRHNGEANQDVQMDRASRRGDLERGDGSGSANRIGINNIDEQEQQRTNTLTDREVLQIAADNIADAKLTDAERDALQIFKNRLTKLEDLQQKRAEEGRLYRDQQFGAKVDREAAAETLNRIHTLDEQIKAAEAEVLSVEDKKIFSDVLKKARGVVESKQRAHDTEVFKRYIDRTKNAAAIKKYRERIQKDVDDLSSWVLKPNNKDIVKHIPDAIKDTVIPFLTSIDFTSKQQLRGGEVTKADQALLKRLNALNAALKGNIDIRGMYSGYTDLPPNFMDRLQEFINTVTALVQQNSGEFVINKMTSEELKELASVVKTLKAYVTQINKFHANAMYQHVWEAGDNTISALAAMASDNGRSNGASNFVFWQQIRPAFAFERFGRGGEAIYDGLRRGQAQLAFNTQKIVEFTEKAYTDKEVKAWEREIKNIPLGGHVVKMRVSDIMSFYELSKQPDSLRHMLGEGMRVATYTLNGKKISDNGHALTEKDIADIVGTLTPRQKEVADALQKFMQEQGGAWGNYVSVARFGEELFTNEQYFPINSDGRHLQSTADEQPSAASLYALLNMSFTKSRNELANNRIVIYSIFDVFSNHMASMAQYNAMALPVLDAIKWFNYQQKTEDFEGNSFVANGVREQMTRVYGVPEETRPGSGPKGYAEAFVLNILKAFNGTEAQGIPEDDFWLKSLRRYNMAQVAYNSRVVLQQPLAITRAALLVDYRSIVRGMKLKPSAIKQNIEEMRKYSGIAAWKSLGFYDVNISRGLTDTIKHNATVGQKIGEIGMKGAEVADTLAWAGMWSACKEEVTRKQKLTPKDAGFYEAVTKLFENVIYKTQVVDSILTKNQYMRSKGFGARVISSFMSESVTTASMFIDACDKYNADMKRGMTRSQAWEKNRRMIGRVAYVYAVSAVILAAIQAVADGWRDDDEYETFLEKWLEAFGGNLLDEAMPFNKLPILSQFYEFVKEFISVGGLDIYGQMSNLPLVEIAEKLIQGSRIIYEKASGEDTNYTYYAGIYKLIQGVSGILGLPMAATTRELVAFLNNTIGAFAPSLKIKTYDPGEMNEIKYAYADGYLTFEEAAGELLERGLVDNEDEAYFTISGWEVGEGYSRYDKIYDAVLNGGDFDAAMAELTSHGYTEKDVISQVKSQVGKWYYDEESDVRISKAQAEEMLRKYTDMTDEEITKTINKWSSKVVTGIVYDDIDDEFMAGNITASRAVEMYKRYGSMTDEDAKSKVAVLEFKKKHTSLDGESISYSFVTAYEEYCEPQGIDVDIFHDVWQYNSSAKADTDKNGNAISGSKKTKVLEYINSLPLSKKQKDSLYYAFGWSKNTVYEAPWH